MIQSMVRRLAAKTRPFTRQSKRCTSRTSSLRAKVICARTIGHRRKSKLWLLQVSQDFDNRHFCLAHFQSGLKLHLGQFQKVLDFLN